EEKIAVYFSLFYIFLAVIIGYLITLFPQTIAGATDFTLSYVYMIVFKIFFLLILPLIWFYRSDYSIRDISPKWTSSFRSYLVLFISLIIGIYVNLINLERLDLLKSAMSNFSTQELILRIFLGILFALIGAGIPEELVFRGFVQTRIEKTRGRIFAIFFTTLFFTLWHLPTRYFNASGVEGTAGDLTSVIIGTGIPVFIVGLIIAIFWDKFRNLPALILFHWGVDIIPFIEAFLQIAR
ncbi:MAG: CPBP family intramembrane metalloprotease, partial [Candidatus Heimdallarchaeota archaeon]|nr:CPBP family intramembrane metalloprotease [Candidatus Heimdallarchaeota archaeon]